MVPIPPEIATSARNFKRSTDTVTSDSDCTFQFVLFKWQSRTPWGTPVCSIFIAPAYPQNEGWIRPCPRARHYMRTAVVVDLLVYYMRCTATIGRRLILFRLKNAAVSTTQNWRGGDNKDWWRALGDYSCPWRSLGGAAVSYGVSSFRRRPARRAINCYERRTCTTLSIVSRTIQRSTNWRCSRNAPK